MEGVLATVFSKEWFTSLQRILVKRFPTANGSPTKALLA